LIIDFPFRFSEKKDILADIPEEEYSSLALKCCSILRDLLTKREFIKEGSVEDRMERYESKSNFLDKFINLFVNMDNPDTFITKNDFKTKFSEWCIEHRHRKISDTSLGRDMKERGIETGRKEFSWMNDGKGGVARVWLGLGWRE